MIEEPVRNEAGRFSRMSHTINCLVGSRLRLRDLSDMSPAGTGANSDGLDRDGVSGPPGHDVRPCHGVRLATTPSGRRTPTY